MIKAIGIIIVGTILLSAMLTPGVYAGIEYSIGAENMWPFSRIFDRVAMVVLVALVWRLRRDIRLSELKNYFTKELLGARGAKLLFGFVLTFFTGLVVLWLVVGRGEYEWRERTLGYYFGKTSIVILGALLTSCIEESFFRVLLLSKLRERFPLFGAAVICSVVYAIVHFIQPVPSWRYPGFSFFAGFSYLDAIIERALLPGVLPAFLGLFFVGMVLAYTMARTGSVYLCIGLHAGWITALKMALFSTKLLPGVQLPQGSGDRYFLVADPMSWISVGIVSIVLLLLQKKIKVTEALPT